jgi:hypothetical protein
MMSLAAALVAASAHAAPRAADPDWPCQQRLVPELTAAAYWRGPPLQGLGDWRADPEIAELVRRLSPRRVTTQEGLAKIAFWDRQLGKLCLEIIAHIEIVDPEARILQHPNPDAPA